MSPTAPRNLLSNYLPQRARKWVPSPMGLGLAFTFHLWYGLSMFIGGLTAWAYGKFRAKEADLYTFPVAAGIITGESLMGIFLILLPLIVAFFAGNL